MMEKILLGVLILLLPFFVVADHDLTDDVFEEVKYEESPRAQYTLGLMYLQGRDVAENEKLALFWLKKSADQDYYLALHRLGKIYLSDDVVETDPEVAVKYIIQAAQKGYAPSQYLLGMMYQTGESGLAENQQTALRWLNLAAGQGHKMAKQVLVGLSNGDESNVSSNAQAAFDTGFNFLKGRGGVDRDYKQAAEWFSKAAEQGHADAQYNLGELYNRGRGVKKNKKTAQKWYKAAAEQGHVKAKYRARNCAFC